MTARRLVQEGGLVLEQYGEVGILQVYEGVWERSEEEIHAFAQSYLQKGLKSIYRKNFVRDRTKETAGQGMYDPAPYVGVPSPAEIEIQEHGLKFVIKPYDGFSVGIFLDQSENRRFLSGRASGKRVLNGFSYTCAFSVGCAAAGAAVTSVDLSKKYLEWGKRNFQINGLDPTKHRFFATDMFKFLDQESKRGNEYELVILDPPSFSRDKKAGTFSLKRDLAKLLEKASSVVTKGGELFFSCNFSEWDADYLKKTAVKVIPRALTWIELPLGGPIGFLARLE